MMTFKELAIGSCFIAKDKCLYIKTSKRYAIRYCMSNRPGQRFNTYSLAMVVSKYCDMPLIGEKWENHSEWGA